VGTTAAVATHQSGPTLRPRSRTRVSDRHQRTRSRNLGECFARGPPTSMETCRNPTGSSFSPPCSGYYTKRGHSAGCVDSSTMPSISPPQSSTRPIFCGISARCDVDEPAEVILGVAPAVVWLIEWSGARADQRNHPFRAGKNADRGVSPRAGVLSEVESLPRDRHLRSGSRAAPTYAGDGSASGIVVQASAASLHSGSASAEHRLSEMPYHRR
jgi:hypothetical protein